MSQSGADDSDEPRALATGELAVLPIRKAMLKSRWLLNCLRTQGCDRVLVEHHEFHVLVDALCRSFREAGAASQSHHGDIAALLDLVAASDRHSYMEQPLVLFLCGTCETCAVQYRYNQYESHIEYCEQCQGC